MHHIDFFSLGLYSSGTFSQATPRSVYTYTDNELLKILIASIYTERIRFL